MKTPTTQEISDIIVADLEASISQQIPLLPKAFQRVLAKVLGGVGVLLYKYAGWILLQMFARHATAREVEINGRRIRPLIELGRRIGVGDPYAAVRAELVVAVTVTTQEGSLAGLSQLVRPETGIIYTTTAAVPLDAAIVQVTIRAASDQLGGDGSGSLGNLQPGDIVQFANPIPNVGTNAVVVSTVVQGADAEPVEVYRGRVVRREQRKPQGGAYADYQIWGEEVAGILHVYPYTGLPGQVDVYVEATEDSSGDPDGIPTGAQLTAVYDSIQVNQAGLASRRPANAAVNVLPITRTGFQLQVFGLLPDTPENRAAIDEGADEHLRSREPFILGLSSLPRDDRVTKDELGGVVAAIVNAAGATVTKIELFPGPAYTLGPGEKSKLEQTDYL